MRAPNFFVSLIAAGFLTACGPQERSPEFYEQADNAAEFTKAFEFCSKSGMSQKEKCAPVWQAKMKMDKAEERDLFERAIAERVGVTIVPQSRNQAPAAEKVSSRKAPNMETATADSERPSARN